jgi:GNAT superfamily N-acetyltransferase
MAPFLCRSKPVTRQQGIPDEFLSNELQLLTIDRRGFAIGIYEVPRDRIDAAADATADSFIGASCPIGIFMFQGEPDSPVLKRRFYRSLVTSCSPKALIHGTSPDLEAVSIWFPPGMDHSEDVDMDPFVPGDFHDPGTMGRIQAVNDVIDELTGHLGDEPQWYLHLVAVRPQFAGLGYASILVKPMLAKAAGEGLPCTLITQTMDNVRKYEHWGFRVVKEMAVPGSREKFCSMRKE